MKVHVLITSHRYGEDVSVHATPEGVLNTLHDYVKDQWEQEDVPGEIPADRDAAIGAYFEYVEDECAEIHEREVLP